MSAVVKEFKTASDVHEARRDEEWHEGAMSVLTYPTQAPVAYFDYDQPRGFGQAATVGDAVTKDDAGNFTVARIGA